MLLFQFYLAYFIPHSLLAKCLFLVSNFRENREPSKERCWLDLEMPDNHWTAAQWSLWEGRDMSSKDSKLLPPSPIPGCPASCSTLTICKLPTALLPRQAFPCVEQVCWLTLKSQVDWVWSLLECLPLSM